MHCSRVWILSECILSGFDCTVLTFQQDCGEKISKLLPTFDITIYTWSILQSLIECIVALVFETLVAKSCVSKHATANEHADNNENAAPNGNTVPNENAVNDQNDALLEYHQEEVFHLKSTLFRDDCLHYLFRLN